jgi:dihydropteroate synthase
MARKRYLWKVRDREIQLGDRTLLVGVLNVTPDSFSDGGSYQDPDRACAHALAMEEQGADLIDVGAESTRPSSKPVTEEDEWRRLAPVLKRLRGKLAIPISVDTYKSGIAERALDLGVEIINDPTGLTFDPLLSKMLTQYNAGVIVNHMRGRPETWAKLPGLTDPTTTVSTDLLATIHRARTSGVDLTRMVIDPGLGFGKRKEENSRLIAELPAFRSLDVPLMAGPSRKSFLNQTSPQGLLLATAAAVTACILGGVHLVRVHDVAEMATVVEVADAVEKFLV